MAVPNHSDIVKQLHAEQPPEKTVVGALAFSLRLIARLRQRFPDEEVGLQTKTAGESIAPFNGTLVSANRIAYKQHNVLIKVLTDTPTTNGPSWQEDGPIRTGGHFGAGFVAVDATENPVPDSGTTVPNSSAPVDLSPLLTRLTLLESQAKTFHELATEIAKQIGLINRQLAELDGQVVKRADLAALLPEYEGRAPIFGGTVISKPRG